MSKEVLPTAIEEDAYYVDEKGFEKGFQSAGPQPIKKKPWWKLGGRDQSFVSVNSGYPPSSSVSSSDTNLPADTKPTNHVWETEESKEIYKPIEGYEGSHRFDPSFKWDPEEEKRLVKTVSIVMPFSVFIFTPNVMLSSIGVLHYQHVSCFSHFSLIEEISPRLYQIPC
jgi:hypothetical protein